MAKQRRCGAKRKAKITLSNVTTVGHLNDYQLKHLQESGARLQLESIRHEDGTPTGLEHRRIKSEIECLYSRGVLTADQLAACQTFQAYCAQSVMGCGPIISQYEPRLIDNPNKPKLYAAEFSVNSLSDVKQIYRKVSANLHFILDWLKANVTSGLSLKNGSLMAYPKLGEAQARFHFRRALKATSDELIEVLFSRYSRDTNYMQLFN